MKSFTTEWRGRFVYPLSIKKGQTRMITLITIHVQEKHGTGVNCRTRDNHLVNVPS